MQACCFLWRARMTSQGVHIQVFRRERHPEGPSTLNFQIGQPSTWWTFRARKKYLTIPPPPKKIPNSPQTPSRPLPLLENPPPCGFFNKKPMPPPSQRLGPFPLPERRKIKNIRNVHQVKTRSKAGFGVLMVLQSKLQETTCFRPGV